MTWDDGAMTHEHDSPDAPDADALAPTLDELQADLEAVDAADAPSVAEELATQLAAKLEGEDEGVAP